MRTIVLASQKGGVGKTTLTGHIAVEAERRGGGSVAIIDTDPQAGLSGWFRVREASTPTLVRVLPAGLAATLRELEQAGMALVVVDTPPAITDAIRDTVAHADLVVIPAKPSPHDLRAIGATVDLVERAGRPMVFVVNQATQRARITADAAISLSQHGTVAPVTIHHRVDFATSMIDGRTVGELDPNSRSAGEIVLLWDYLDHRLSRVNLHVAESIPTEPQPRRP
jgi:chromosome partitioning protein